jgi:bifunctional DNA-binding transcriptional regulator/antitoxin component of YhaV-PrlF toxin-antitoxin module
MRITSKGQVTIPADIRAKSGLLPHTDVSFRLGKQGEVVMSRSRGKKSAKPSRGELLVKRLTGTGTIKMTTDEIMALTRGD